MCLQCTPENKTLITLTIVKWCQGFELEGLMRRVIFEQPMMLGFRVHIDLLILKVLVFKGIVYWSVVLLMQNCCVCAHFRVWYNKVGCV